MRKYFLLSLSCIFSSYQANADNSFAAGQFTAGVYVTQADEITCEQNLEARIVVKDKPEQFTLQILPNAYNMGVSVDTNVITAVVTPAQCTISNGTFTDVSKFELPTVVPLNSAGSDDILSATQSTIGDFELVISPDGKSVNIGGTFTIYPEDIPNTPDQMIGSVIPITYTYE
ncbi:MAG: hypothetical protein E7016_01520 [Alphaproteobacteria bacterium]|nr:hypothetical protein [Alphaproteobacteria bacterium]